MTKIKSKAGYGDKQLANSNISLIFKIVLIIFGGLIYLPSANADEKIFSNSNKNVVHNLKTTSFKLTQPMLITRIDTYHWNDQQGSPPGKIGIRGVGLWQATGWPGMHNTPDANWTVHPNIRLEPGIYFITDSDPATWSQNSGSGGLGFVEVFGQPIAGTSSNSGSLSNPTKTNTGNWLDGFTSGKVHNGKAFQGSKSWPFTIRITDYNKTTGALVGELTWKSLNSIHLIRGTINGSKLTFKEEQAIKRGGAHLNVVYTMQISNKDAKGTWIDQGDKSTGDVLISG